MGETLNSRTARRVDLRSGLVFVPPRRELAETDATLHPPTPDATPHALHQVIRMACEHSLDMLALVRPLPRGAGPPRTQQRAT